MVPLVTPARRATSSSLVAAKPRSTKTSSAAATISSGRAFLRRCQRGFFGTAVRGIQAPELVTERSVSNSGSPPPSSPAVVENQPRHRRRDAHLAQQGYDLPPVIRRVIDGVAKHLPQGVPVLSAGRRLHSPRLVHPIVAELRQKRPPLCLDLLPPRPHLRGRVQVLALGDRGVGLF